MCSLTAKLLLIKYSYSTDKSTNAVEDNPKNFSLSALHHFIGSKVQTPAEI
jgi:hypothetical protein